MKPEAVKAAVAESTGITNNNVNKAIDHFKKLLPCEQFIITGSYAWKLLGLTKKVKDLDIILVKPNEDAIKNLEMLREPENPDYPPNKNQYFVKYNDMHIDFYVKSSKIDTIDLANGLSISIIKGTILANKHYGRIKDTMQLKAIADIFCSNEELMNMIENEVSKYK